MERALIWFKCAAMHDPVRPVIKAPAIIGWEARNRQVDMVIERSFNGHELIRRMKGWVTADVVQAIEILSQYGRLRVLDNRDLVLETTDAAQLNALSEKLSTIFNEEVWIEPIQKQRLE